METSRQLDFGILLLLAEQEFVAGLRARNSELGFNDQGRSDGAVLRALAVAPTTISALAERLGITKQGAGQIVDDMQRRGYVERRPDPTDARARLLHLTERGEQALAAARRFHQSYERKLRRQFGDEAIDTVRAVLTAMTGEAQLADPRFRTMVY